MECTREEILKGKYFFIYHSPTENSHLKEWVGHGLMSRWEMNGGRGISTKKKK